MKVFPGKYGFSLWGVTLAAGILLSGCIQNAFLRGQVTDVSGEELPGVIVRVVGTEYEGLSNTNGGYSFRTMSGTLDVEFSKTGYTSVHKQVSVPSLGMVDVERVALWPLPMGEGIYTFQEYKYRHADHPRVNRYLIEDSGIAYGTPVEPSLNILYSDPKTDPDANPPRFYAHKLPAYDVRLHKLRKVKAAISQTRTGSEETKDRKNVQYNEAIWIPEEAIPLLTHPVDEPEHLLLQLRPVQPLDPGVYAFHWGAIDGYDGIDPRAFLFSVIEETPGEGEYSEEGEGEEDAPQKEKKSKSKDRK